MKKSISTPSLAASPPCIRRSVSTNALPELSVIEAMIITKAPIYHNAQCLSTSDFPEHLLKGEPPISEDFLRCLVTPYDPPAPEKVVTVPQYTRSFLQLSAEYETYQQKYVEWLRRVRRNRRGAVGGESSAAE